MARTSRWLAAAAAVAVGSSLLLPADVAEARGSRTVTGPSSSQSPFLIPTASGVSTESLITVGDSAANGYRLVGIPDGLGAFDNGDGTITLVVNHELGATKGVVRAHGSKGAFVSKWIIRKSDHKVLSGSDLIQRIMFRNPDGTYASGTTAIDRLCSADLPPVSAFYNAKTGKGYNGRLFMNGEEAATGRAFAHEMNGTSWDLPDLGRFSWENSLANPSTGDKTVVIGTDDSTPGQVYVYVGAKKRTGNAVEKAGLAGGELYGITTPGFTDEYDPATGNGVPGFNPTAFTLSGLGNVGGLDPAGLQALSESKGVTEWWRPEDGAWDARNPNVFYFNTTAKFDGTSRLWKLAFRDVRHPELGGKVTRLLDGTEGQHMLDNMAAANNGRQLILNEDPGNNAYLASVYSYNLRSDRLTKVAEHDPSRFSEGGSQFLTIDEESSGTIDVSRFFGRGTYLITTQVHQALADPELVENGQLQILRVPWAKSGHGHK
jgi:hypothetical protein